MYPQSQIWAAAEADRAAMAASGVSAASLHPRPGALPELSGVRPGRAEKQDNGSQFASICGNALVLSARLG